MPSRPAHLLAVSAACLLAASGCGDGVSGRAGGVGGGAAKLERLLKVKTAQALLTDTGVPTPPADDPSVREAAEKLDIDCEPTGRRDFECGLDYGGGHRRHCAFRTNASVDRVRWSRCGVEHPPEVDSEHVDCADTGAVVTIDDPGVEMVPDTSDGQLHPATDGPGLARVRVAASSDALCVEWQSGGRVEPPVYLHFHGYSPSDSRANVALTVSLSRDEPPEVGTSAYGSIDGSIGVRDDSVSLLVQRDDLVEPQRALLDGPFTFSAGGFGEELQTGDVSPAYP